MEQLEGTDARDLQQNNEVIKTAKQNLMVLPGSVDADKVVSGNICLTIQSGDEA